jgi:hypothetical protein
VPQRLLSAPEPALRPRRVGSAFTACRMVSDALWSHYTRGPAGAGLFNEFRCFSAILSRLCQSNRLCSSRFLNKAKEMPPGSNLGAFPPSRRGACTAKSSLDGRGRSSRSTVPHTPQRSPAARQQISASRPGSSPRTQASDVRGPRPQTGRAHGVRPSSAHAPCGGSDLRRAIPSNANAVRPSTTLALVDREPQRRSIAPAPIAKVRAIQELRRDTTPARLARSSYALLLLTAAAAHHGHRPQRV